MIRKSTSIRWEIMSVFFLMAFIIICAFSVTVLTIQKRSLINEIELRGQAIVNNLANNIADFLLVKYELEVAKMLKETTTNKGVEYAFVVDKNNIIIAHNDMKMVKKNYIQPLNIKQITSKGNIIYEAQKGQKIINFVADVISKGKVKLGVVHVGISYSIIEDVLRQTYINIIIVTVIAFILSILFSFFLSAAITRPINKMAEAAKIIGSGNLDYKIDIKRKNELGILAQTINMMTENLKMAHIKELEQKAFEKELEIASEIQKSLLPNNFPGMTDYNVYAYYKPARIVGGDYYDVIKLDINKFGIVMADVAGKGIPAALVMTMVSGILNIKARLNKDIRQVIVELNDELLMKSTNSMFITLFYGILDNEKNILEMISAGYHEILIYRYSSKRVDAYCLKGAALGLLDGRVLENRLETQKDIFDNGDKMLLFTDGISEAKNKEGERFGIKKIVEILNENGSFSGDIIIEKLKMEIENFIFGQEQDDDIALLIVERK